MRLLWSFLALTALTATALAQVDWTEQGDAGDLPETAQATGTDTNTPLSSISGALDARRCRHVRHLNRRSECVPSRNQHDHY
jgi:hypothetical protein